MSAWDRDGSAVPRADQGRAALPSPGLAARTRFWHSVRIRILLPVVLATIAVLVLGTMQFDQALDASEQSDRSSRLARTTTDIGALAHHLALEYVLQNEARRAGTEPPSLLEQEQATDDALARFRVSTVEIRATAPDLAGLCDTADRALAGLDSARAIVRQVPDGSAEVRAFYDQMLRTVLAVADALPAQMSDPRLIELARSVALLGELHHLGALQLDLVARGLGRKQFDAADPIQLAEWVGAERKQAEALANLQPAGDHYRDLVSQSTVATAASIRQVILDGRGTPASLALDPAAWSRAQKLRLEGLWAIEQEAAGDLSSAADDAAVAARERTYLIGGLSVVVVVLTMFAAIVMAVRLSRRLRRTRHAALAAARVELPSAVANVTAARDAEGVRSALSESSQRVDAMLTTGPDEIGELSAAFGAVHRQALRLAADQALMRMEVQAMFVALSRRGQTLVQRQIHLIDEFGRGEADPDALERLFALDHLAARMRRNEENLLVLAGGEPGRWITRPVALHDLLRAAAQEIEEYRRVQIADVPPLAVASHVAGDAIHLLAELMENATSFSPPTSVVRIEAARTVDGLAIAVIDEGIGMPDVRLAEANERLAQPSVLTSTLVGTMGLLVVARLAQRHGIHIRLDSSPAHGTTATVTLPDRLAIPLSMVDQLQPGRWLRDLSSTAGDQTPAAAAVTSLPRADHPSGQPGSMRQPLNGPAQPPLSQRPVSPAIGRAFLGQPDPVSFIPAQRPPQPLLEDDPDRTMNLIQRDPDEEPVLGTTSSMTPDPETVRARLSSLASGIAAARQGEPAPPPVP